jgi:hypothetical protein
VRKVQTPSGPFAFRLYFEDLGEIDKICLEALTSQSLLPSDPAPIRIERFVEKQFKAPLRYEDLGPRAPRLHDIQFFGRCRGDTGIPVVGGTEHDSSPQTSSFNYRSRSRARSFARITLHRRQLCAERCSWRKATTNTVPVGRHSRGHPAVLCRPMVGIPGKPSDRESSASELAYECIFESVRH